MESEKISFREHLGYGVGDVAHQLGYGTFSWFMVIYYTQVLKINSAAAAVVTLAAMFVGGVADVAAGIAVDKTQTRFGKARPWIMRMMAPYAIFLALMFSVPDAGMGMKTIWAFSSLLIFNVIYSFINTPYGVLNSLITYDRFERSNINLFRTFLAYSGAVLVSCITPMIVKSYGGSYGGWSRTGITYGVLAVVIFLILLFSTKERVNLPSAAQSGLSLGKSFRALVKNDAWLFNSTTGGVYYIFYVSNCSTTLLYVSYIMHLPSALQQTLYITVALSFYIPIIIGSLVLPKLIYRFGKRNLCMAGLGIIAAGSLILIAQPANVPLLIACSIIKGFGMAPIMGCYFAMAADTIEYGEWKTGVRIEGLTYSTSSFTTKVGSGLGSAVVSIALAISGYSAQAGAQPASVPAAIWFMYLIVPLILCAVMFVLLARYKLDKVYQRVERDLMARRKPSAG